MIGKNWRLAIVLLLLVFPQEINAAPCPGSHRAVGANATATGSAVAALMQATAEEFCRNITGALQNPSFETKQRVLRLVVDTIVVDDDQITIKHLIPISNVHLRRYYYSDHTPVMKDVQREESRRLGKR